MSKISTLESICNIIRQGRCTLVTTLQIYKILALNFLISAYSLSFLRLDGISYADFQSTIIVFLITFLFCFSLQGQTIAASFAQTSSIKKFNFYILSSKMLQFVVNLGYFFAMKVIGKLLSCPPRQILHLN